MKPTSCFLFLNVDPWMFLKLFSVNPSEARCARVSMFLKLFSVNPWISQGALCYAILYCTY